MSKRRPTQKDIAAIVGVHHATVSLALKNHPSIPDATRERILQAAREVGYIPDPMLSALASYRSGLKTKGFQGTLAWLVVEQDGFDWRSIETYRLYYEGAVSRAKTYGYHLEVFTLVPRAISPERLASIFVSRSINGILLCPQPAPNSIMDFPWDRFSFVTFGYSLVEPELHTVTATQFRSMTQIMQRMHGHGYQRIAFVFQKTHDERTEHNFLAAYLAAQYQVGEDLLVFDYDWKNMEGLELWLKENQPQAMVVGDEKILQQIQSSKIKVPKGTGVACPNLSKHDSRLAGIVEDSYHIGEVAVDHLTTMVTRGQRGAPHHVQRIHVEGKWMEGESLPSLRKSGKCAT